MVAMSARGERIYELLRQVRPLTLSSARVVESRLRDHGLTVGMRAVLEIVAESGPATVPELARTLDVSRQATQRLANELVRAGYAQTVPNPRHRRSVLLTLTRAGSDTFAAIHRRELEQLATLAPGCSEEDVRTAVRVLTQVAADVRRLAHSADTDPADAPDRHERSRGWRRASSTRGPQPTDG
jgi:DNA-binding MarR family transcriptional regulator